MSASKLTRIQPKYPGSQGRGNGDIITCPAKDRSIGRPADRFVSVSGRRTFFVRFPIHRRPWTPDEARWRTPQPEPHSPLGHMT